MPTQPSAPIVEAAVRIANASDTSLRVLLEPWGREFSLAAGAAQVFEFIGPDRATIEVEVRPGEVKVFGWVGSTVDDQLDPNE